MHVLDTKYREEFRKVILSKFISMRKKHEKKVQNMYSSGSSHKGFFFSYQHKSLHLCSESTVDSILLLLYRFLLQSAYFILKRVVSFLNKSVPVSQSPGSAVWFSGPVSEVWVQALPLATAAREGPHWQWLLSSSVADSGPFETSPFSFSPQKLRGWPSGSSENYSL